MKSIYEIIKRPIISEKATALAEVGNRYVFEVNPRANKQEIRSAVQKLFAVKVLEVRTMVVHGKEKRNAKGAFKRANWKKALVTLQSGQKIDFFQTK